LLDILAVDLRNALRIFRRSPGFAATAVVSLAVGIAAVTGLFSIVNAALLNPFPFADIDRIVRLDMIDKGKPRGLGVTARQLVALLGVAELFELVLQQPAALSRPDQHKGGDRQDTGGERQRHAQSWSAGRPHARE
jgi:hypothetical protein